MQDVYRGPANRIMAQSRDGRRVSLLTYHLPSYLTHQGSYGSFALEISATGELLTLGPLP